MAETILLVEDEDGLRTYLKTELEFEGYTVLTAEDGLGALATYRKNQYAIGVILLDWMLPELDGLEVLRRIRKGDDVPVIMMTARDYVGDKVAGLDAGADDYITKPFEIEELLARIRVVIRHQLKSTVATYQVGDLQLDVRTRTPMRGCHTCETLTQRETDLLVLLMQHAGTPVTRSEMLDRVWGKDYDGQVNIIDVYIRYLRNKIDLPDFAPLIHTVRGVGYVMRADDDEQ
ncbi:response regulator transcription factor [Lacticaseibacillus hulanensis]|jgi:DNA-binding response OmpR family regulator|uniref:response regulator transcription factor n=1 Tax=Lacticaseibacillus hulanensis TaxID=2493111 RepID=UPI000FD9E9A3|nr:response regulator transcription factor [Lacticaseibacillus hulanensis]